MSELKQSIAQLLIDNFKGATSKKASDMAIAIMAFVNADREREIESAFCGTPGTGECSCRKFADNPLKCDNRRIQPEATNPAQPLYASNAASTACEGTGPKLHVRPVKPAQDLSAAIPDGWQLVPTVPTDEMIEELRINIDFSYEEGLEISTGKYHPCALIKEESIGEAYSAMLAAAPLAESAAEVQKLRFELANAVRAAEGFATEAAAWRQRAFKAEERNAALASPADALVAGDRVDAERWRMFTKALRTYLPGPGHGVRIKVVEICPMYGEETEVENLEKLLDRAIQAQKDGHGDD